jgi:hypothetical protein
VIVKGKEFYSVDCKPFRKIVEEDELEKAEIAD